MSILDRFIFWSARRRGFHVVEESKEKPRVDYDSDVMRARRERMTLQRKVEHLDAVAEAAGLKIPNRGGPRVDIR